MFTSPVTEDCFRARIDQMVDASSFVDGAGLASAAAEVGGFLLTPVHARSARSDPEHGCAHRCPGGQRKAVDRQSKLYACLVPEVDCISKGKQGYRLHAVLCAAGYNIRWLMRTIAKKGVSFLARVFAPRSGSGTDIRLARLKPTSPHHTVHHSSVRAAGGLRLDFSGATGYKC